MKGKITAGIPFTAYQRYRGVSWSSLMHARTSWLEFRDRLLNPRPATAAMDLGSAIHCAVLEPEVFASRYAVFDGRRGTTAHGEWQAEHIGMVDLKPAEWEQCMGAAWAVHEGAQGRQARRIMRFCRAELSLRWTDPHSRVLCKARPDLVGPHVLADLKTTGSVDARKFGRLAGDLGYHGKMAFASMGLEAMGRRPDDVYIIAVEQTAPHDVGVFRLCDGDRDNAEIEVGRLLAGLQECRRKRRWPGRYQNTELLDLPAWTFERELDNDISDLGFALAIRDAGAGGEVMPLGANGGSR